VEASMDWLLYLEDAANSTPRQIDVRIFARN
jgi:hypothetical protein